MPYVMVPVPEEHVPEIMAAVLRVSRRAELEDWDAESVDTYFRGLDEPSKALLSVIARSVVAEKPMSQVNVADALELSQREVLGIMREANDEAGRQSRPPVLINHEKTETLPNGRTRTVSVISTSNELAIHIRAAEKAELAENGDPLSGLEG